MQSIINTFLTSTLQQYNDFITKKIFIDKTQLNTCITEFISTINPTIVNTKSKLDLSNISVDNSISDITSSSVKTKKEEKNSSSIKKTKKDTSIPSVECEYIFQSGAKKGEKCITKAVAGSTRCSRHKNSGDSKEEIKSSKVINTTTVKNDEVIEEKKKITPKTNETITSISRSQYGNYVEKNTGFVFDRTTQKCVGKETTNGAVIQLTPNDIELCKSNGWIYLIPTNLSQLSITKDLEIEDDLYENSDDEDN